MKAFKIIDLIVKIIWSIICILMFILMFQDILYATKHPEEYHFGEDILIWYHSLSNYITFGIVIIFWFLLGILPLILLKRIKISDYTFIIHLLATLSYMIYNFNSFNDW